MSSLLDSGVVGTNMGSEEEIVCKWENVGFLDYIDEKYKTLLALRFEDMAYFMKNNPESYDGNSQVEVVSFPVFLRIIKGIVTKESSRVEVTEEERRGIINDINIETLLKKMNNNLDSCMNVFADIHEEDVENPTKIDLEAEATCFLAEQLSKRYYNDFITEKIKEQSGT